MNPRYPPEVLSTDSNYKGLSYGDLVAIRANWLFSESPDYQYQSDILHLHGNMHYWSGQAAEADDFYDRRGDLEERITPDTAIFVPVMTATYVIGDKYEGLTLEDEAQFPKGRKNGYPSCGLWATIQQEKRTNERKPILNGGDINDYMIESPLFKLKVS